MIIMEKRFSIKGMHCNSCANSIESVLKHKVKKVSVSFTNETADIEFDEKKISEKEIKNLVKEAGYKLVDFKETKASDNIGWIFLAFSILIFIGLLYYLILPKFSSTNISLPSSGENAGYLLLLIIGFLTGFHCISMCGGFVVSYTTKNAINGYKGFKQHLVYGGSKVLSYTIIGAIFGLIGGIFAFNVLFRGYIAIFAAIFMIFYALSMFGIKFFRRFQINPKFLSRLTINVSKKAKGPYFTPFITGLLNGLFIACGPLQAMYIYAAGTGSMLKGALSLAVFGVGTLPIMLGFGGIASAINHNTTKKILKLSAIIVLIIGLIMLNRGLSLVGSPYNYDTIKSKITNSAIPENLSGVKIENGYQIINMNVDASGYSPNSFVLKKGIPVKWNINVKELTSCNQEIVANAYNIQKNLKSGQNLIEFTPTSTGTIPFSCGMGMLHGNFIVTESGTASQVQVKAATPKPSQGGCKMGSGGSGCGMASCGSSGSSGCGCGK